MLRERHLFALHFFCAVAVKVVTSVFVGTVWVDGDVGGCGIYR